MSVLQFIILLLAAASCCAAPKPENDHCQKPDNIKEAQLQGEWNEETYPPGTVANFDCLPGYTQDGLIKMACIEGTWWQIGKGKCKEITCSPPHVEKGSVDAKKAMYNDGEEIDVKCDDGYVLRIEPNKPRKCTSNGWFPPLSCIIKKCDRPDIKNGELYNYYFPRNPGTTINYRCNTNYLSPQKGYWGTTSCTKFGWNSEPKCLRQCSFLKAHFENAELVNLQSIYLEGEEVTFRCKSSFQTREGKTSGIRTCLPNGEFTTAKCSKTCTAPRLLHGKYTPNKNEFSNGEHLQYECDKGYMTEKHNLLATAQCLDEKWSEIPKCIAITCELGSSSYKDKDVISYKCPHGKRPKSDLVQCFNYGWGPPIICQEKKPDEPDATNPPLEDIEKEEKKKTCPIAHNPRNAEIINMKKAYYSNDEVTMKCKRGYRMYGSATIRCIEGKWEQPPECYEIGDQCGPPPTIQFGDTIEIRKFIYKPGEFVEYKCPIYHLVKGEKIVKCLNGVWGEAPVCLEPCTAKENSMDENNIQLRFAEEKKKYLKHGENIEFSCIFGYEALPTTQMRITCEHGKLEYPKCLRKGFCILQQSEMIANNINYNVSIVVERGQTVTFQCNEEMIPEKRLEATCTLGKIQYPKCSAAVSSG
ncbi:coagulation factor XIII B chain-like isoform X2 [Phyllobates terribilis]|uniref:coagulation factor XIII B chain-like isoform X2 n=1 Tax=Phyllobates terribilis TaxID=111132 RepID=UPI003CCABB30